MKILVASDSFKGTLSSYEVGCIVKEELKQEHQVKVLSVSDGGEGLIESIEKNIPGDRQYIDIKSPIGKVISGYYYLTSDKKTAVIESAIACGISLLFGDELNPLYTSTYGLGQLINDAISKGVKKIIIGIGGTSTNDGGTGMLEAMGVNFFDVAGEEIFSITGGKLDLINSFDLKHFKRSIKDIEFEIACDVNNVLLGKDGATFTFGPQKGADEEMCNYLESGMKQFAKVTEKYFDKEIRNIPGSGAAGGLGMSFLSFFSAKLKSGIELVLDIALLDTYLDDCNLIITGEGKMDYQTERGKVPIGVAKRANSKNIKTVAICGMTDIDEKENVVYEKVFSVVPNITSASESLSNPRKYLTELIKKELIPWLHEI